MDKLRTWWSLFDFCFNVDPGSYLCRPFWSNAVLAFIGAGFVLVLFGVTKYVSYRRNLRRAHIAEWMRNSVDESAIKAEAWTAHEQPLISVSSDEELLSIVRAGVEQRRREVRGIQQPE